MLLIKQSAIDEFRDRERDDWRWMKKLSDAELDRYADDLSVVPPIWSKLKKHQKVSFLLGAWFKRFFWVLDTGSGKSLLAIALALYFKAKKKLKKVLVLSPRRTNKQEWADELMKHSPKSSYVVLSGTIEERWETLRTTDATFIFESYAGLLHLTCDKAVAKTRSKKPKNVMKPNRAKVLELAKLCQMLVLDESFNASNTTKLPFRICNALSKKMPYFFAMTATPFNRDPEPLWAQMVMVDRGYSLGETLTLFRSLFYNIKKGHWSMFEYTFKANMKAALHQFLAHRSIEYEANETDLPRRNRFVKEVQLPQDAQVYYERAKDALIASQGNYREVKNIFLRMRQISSGFVGYENDETGQKAKLVFPDNPKMDLLLSKCEDLRPGQKAIIFFEYTYTGERIVKELRKLKRQVNILHGKTKTKDVAKIKSSFNKGALDFLVLQNSFGIGLNLQAAKYAFFMESPVAPSQRYQCERRVIRQYSKHERVFIYDFITKGTMDSRILKFHKTGQDLMQSLVRGRGSMIR